MEKKPSPGIGLGISSVYGLHIAGAGVIHTNHADAGDV
jgi:hypothetical protein